MDPSKTAEELLVKWINGQKKYVMDELSEMPGLQAACVSAMLCVELNDGRPTSSLVDSFIAHMELLL